MSDEVLYEVAMEWLEHKLFDCEPGEVEIIKHIQEVLWQDNDIRNS
jgi:hypothetical protein